VTKLTKPISRETIQQYRHYGKTIIVTLFADCISLRLKGTRKEKAYQLPIPHLMDELCRREARRGMIDKLKNRECRKRLI
jgi:hypothetical protein